MLRWDAQLLVDCGMTAVGHPVALLDHVESWNGRNGQGNISSRLDFGLVKHHNSTGSVIWDSLDRSFPSKSGTEVPNFKRQMIELVVFSAWAHWAKLLNRPWRAMAAMGLSNGIWTTTRFFKPGWSAAGSLHARFSTVGISVLGLHQTLIVSSNKPPHFDVLNTKKLDTPHPNKYGCCAVSECNTWNGRTTCLYVYTFCGSFDEHILTSNSQLRWGVTESWRLL